MPDYCNMKVLDKLLHELQVQIELPLLAESTVAGSDIEMVLERTQPRCEPLLVITMR